MQIKMTLIEFQTAIDAWLIAPYRWLTPAYAGFLSGTLVLAVQSIVIGKLCLKGLEKIQKKQRKKIEDEVNNRQDLSLKAISVQDKAAYIAQNDLAQEAYGRSMGLSLGRICATFWPAVMALAWMKTRFDGIPLEFGLFGRQISFSYPVIFIFIYISVWLLIRKIKKYSFKHQAS